MRKHLARFLVCLFLTNIILYDTITSAAPRQLRDIAGSYAEAQIKKLQAKGIVVGDENGNYHPKSAVTRAEFVTMLARGMGLSPLNSAIAAYRDVPKSYWGYQWIQAGAALGIVNGTTATSFSPSRPISRQEAAALLVRAIKGSADPEAPMSFSDMDEADAWALPFVKKAMELKLMSGYQGYFRPTSLLTREEIAVVLERIDAKASAGHPAPSAHIELGWQYTSSTQEFIADVKKSTVNTLSPRWFFLEANGQISDKADPALVTWAHQNGKKVWALVGNRFDAKLTDIYLSEKRKALIDQLLQKVKTYKLDGINVDFEGVNPDSRELFSAFIKELANALHAQKAVLSVDVPPDGISSWSDPYDYTTLAKSADYIILMAYEEHWSGGPMAGSVASLPWIAGSLDTLTQQIPAQKLIAALPLYTRDWYMSGGKLLSYDLSLPESYDTIGEQAAALVWDAQLGQYKATYRRAGVEHQIWMEESRSIGMKYQTSMQRGTGGVAYWYIGSESDDVWSSVRNADKYMQFKRKASS